VEGAMLRRVRGDLRQKELAELLCIAPSTLSRIERDRRACPPDVAAKVAALTGRPEVLDWYCRGCPVHMMMCKRQRFQLIQGGKRAA
jgi:DNA-binding XRE family transcriptional regulator